MEHFEEIKLDEAKRYAIERYGEDRIRGLAYEKGYNHGWENAILKAAKWLIKQDEKLHDDFMKAMAE